MMAGIAMAIITTGVEPTGVAAFMSMDDRPDKMAKLKEYRMPGSNLICLMEVAARAPIKIQIMPRYWWGVSISPKKNPAKSGAQINLNRLMSVETDN